jgi:glycosyltransferase involved in cell wall biosynthesis
VLVNPENVFEIRKALYRALMDQAFREKLRNKGYEQVKRFSWQNSVSRMLEVYDSVANSSRARSQSAS